MRQTPLLILAYNRADKVRGLIEKLRELRPQLVMVVVDGPKPGNAEDEARVQAVRDAVAAIDWTPDVLTRFRPVNIGLRASVVDAVTWAVDEYGQVIVIEEDVLPGPNFIPYAEYMLEHYRDDERVMHISGYNVVPDSTFSGTAANRLTIYPESIAWATWDRAWRHYDDDLRWAKGSSLRELERITGSRASALRWRQNFGDAESGRISTWAYRWIASMWAQGGLVLSPNHNLVTYAGQNDGTHTTTKPVWEELPLFDGSPESLLDMSARLDLRADRWVTRRVFAGTPFGVLRGVAISVALAIRQRRRAARSAR